MNQKVLTIGKTNYMPNRILREGILDSDRINQLSWAAECFYRRLMSVVDDYGCFDGRISVLRSKLFVLRIDKVSIPDTQKYLTECVKADLVRLYEHESKPYLVIMDFDQTIRIKKRKFPQPPEDAMQMRSRCMPESNPIQSETKPDLNTEPRKARNHLFKDSEFFDFEKFLFEMAKDEKYIGFDFLYYHESAKNWSAQGNEKKDWISTLKNWMLRDLKDGKARLSTGGSNKKASRGNSTPEELADAVSKVVGSR